MTRIELCCTSEKAVGHNRSSSSCMAAMDKGNENTIFAYFLRTFLRFGYWQELLENVWYHVSHSTRKPKKRSGTVEKDACAVESAKSSTSSAEKMILSCLCRRLLIVTATFVFRPNIQHVRTFSWKKIHMCPSYTQRSNLQTWDEILQAT